MNQRIAGLKQRLKSAETTWPFTADELTAHEQQRTARARELREQLDRMKAAAQNPAEADILVLEDTHLTAEHWRAAAARMFDGPEAKKPTLANVVANRHWKGARVIDTLAADERGRLRAALEMQASGILGTTSGSWPHEDCASYFALAELCGPAAATLLRQRMLERLANLTNKRGLPHESEEWQAGLLVMDTLLDTATPGAADLFARWCGLVKPADLDDTSCWREFMEIMARHQGMAPLQAAAERMFTRKGSPWNPAVISYSIADDFSTAGLVQVTAFRKSLLDALTREDVVGALTIPKDSDDQCSINWKNGGSFGKGIDKNETYGVKPGGPAMKLRRCDMLLDAFANAVLAEHVGPPYQIYWPLARRDEGRAAWRQWLAQAPDKRN